MQKITRTGTSIMLQSDVLGIVDRLAAEQQRSRSFIINQLVRLGFRLVQQELAPSTPSDPNSASVKAVVVPPKEIKF